MKNHARLILTIIVLILLVNTTRADYVFFPSGISENMCITDGINSCFFDNTPQSSSNSSGGSGGQIEINLDSLYLIYQPRVYTNSISNIAIYTRNPNNDLINSTISSISSSSNVTLTSLSFNSTGSYNQAFIPKYPGNYTINITATEDVKTITKSAYIEVLEPGISMTMFDGLTRLANNSLGVPFLDSSVFLLILILCCVFFMILILVILNKKIKNKILSIFITITISLVSLLIISFLAFNLLSKKLEIKTIPDNYIGYVAILLILVVLTMFIFFFIKRKKTSNNI